MEYKLAQSVPLMTEGEMLMNKSAPYDEGEMLMNTHLELLDMSADSTSDARDDLPHPPNGLELIVFIFDLPGRRSVR